MHAIRLSALVLALAAGLTTPGPAGGAGGRYVFDGGSAYERAQVRRALSVSAFPWSVVDATVTIHVVRGLPSSSASPGEIWLDADLLDAGEFAWGVVQHEYAHQVDFLVLDQSQRLQLYAELGGGSWCDYSLGLPHGDYGCERFASTLAWAYWPAAANSMRPASGTDESSAVEPAAFRALVATVLDRHDLRAAARPSPR
ncbi:MAG TPA: hypothetical protein VLN26_14465 [Gaiellaceae bacterium]|nr:hypothetical protein [Gaiellaceae bacterium]